MTASPVPNRAECDALLERALSFTNGARAEAQLMCSAGASIGFALGRVHAASLTSFFELSLRMEANERTAIVSTNQIDDAGLRSLAATTAHAARSAQSRNPMQPRPPQIFPAGPQRAFDASLAAMSSEAQASLADRALAAAEAANLVATGYATAQAFTRAVRSTDGLQGFETSTNCSFSMTARNEAKHASGWAGYLHEDWNRIDADLLIKRAVDIGVRSADPVAIEPGRYTVILEPDAVSELIEPIGGPASGFWSGQFANGGGGPFAKKPIGTNKIGLQMMDRRLGMVADPWDDERPMSLITYYWGIIPGAVTWFKDGVLERLAGLGDPPVVDPRGVRLAGNGAATSLEDMIANTRRGLWINRFSNVFVMDPRTMLTSGTTRDGTFLIENGQITKPVKNMRFTESPFFVLNRLEAWGQPRRTSHSTVVPRLMLRDFNFTSGTDAI